LIVFLLKFINLCIQFDGVDDYITTNTTPIELQGNPNLTVSGCFYRNSNLPVNTGT
jgi:hypothetical protein